MVVCKEGIFGREGGAQGLEFNWVPSGVQILGPRFDCPSTQDSICTDFLSFRNQRW